MQNHIGYLQLKPVILKKSADKTVLNHINTKKPAEIFIGMHTHK